MTSETVAVQAAFKREHLRRTRSLPREVRSHLTKGALKLIGFLLLSIVQPIGRATSPWSVAQP
jgi:hypothetical protein